MADQQSQTNAPTLEALLAAGVHFGHQTRRWNPWTIFRKVSLCL